MLKDCSERENFAENITTKISRIKPTGEVEQDLNETKTLLCDAIEETVGFKWKTRFKRKQTIWWNEEVKDAVKVKNRLFRIWVKERTPETTASYITARNDSERIKRLPKKTSRNKVCQDLEADVRDTKKWIYNIANSYRKGKTERPYSIKAKESEDILTVQGEIKTRWTEHYTDLLKIPTEENEEEENQLQGPIRANTNDEITTLEVEAVIERSRNCKATGTDCIPNEIYKAGSVGTVKALTMIFNTSYKTGKIPQEWGRSVICPIYKNKGDFLKCENYRGISLLNHAFKMYESVLERRLRNIVEDKLGPCKHGFRRGKGTTDMTFVLRQLMEKHWEYDTPMYLPFLDLEKAFD